LIYDELISEDFKYKPVKNYFWEFDKTEITRQALSLVFNRLHARLVQAYRIRDKRLLEQTSKEMVSLLKDMDSVVCGFMSGFDSGVKNPFSAELRFTQAEQVGQLWQAKNQVTLWGPVDYPGRNLVDYAAKQECGMISQYYLPRWEVFFRRNQWIQTRSRTFYKPNFSRSRTSFYTLKNFIFKFKFSKQFFLRYLQ